MDTVGVIGLGNMGSGLAKNLIKAGYKVKGHDLLQARMDAVSYTHLTLPTNREV